MFVLLGIVFAVAVISAYTVLAITDWFEKRTNKKFPTGKINKKGE